MINAGRVAVKLEDGRAPVWRLLLSAFAMTVGITHDITEATLSKLSELHIIDRDSLPNADAALCRLPDEILVYVLKLIQGRFPIEGAADAVRIHPYWGPTTVYDQECLAWRHTMLVCARLRGLTLHSPELWALINICWPARWVDLCAARAAAAPLHLVCRIHDLASAQTAARLLPRARDALVLVQQTTDDGPPDEPVDFAQCLRTVLQAHAAPRSLTIENGDYSIWKDVRHCAAMTLHGHTLGGARSTVTHLSLEHLCLGEDLPIFPSLERLRLHAVVPPADPAWLHRWLVSSERLQYLTLSDISPDPIQIDPHLPCPVELPCLDVFSIGATIEVVLSLLQLLPHPARELSIHIFDFKRIKDEYTSAPVTPGQCQDVLAYVQAYWRGAALPAAVIELDGTRASDWGNRALRLAAPRRLSVNIYHTHVRDVAPFLPLVDTCTLKVYALDDTGVYPVWPELDHLPALAQLRIHPERFRSPAEAGGIQVWADDRARAGLPPVQVEIRQRGRSEPPYAGPWCTRVVWSPADGPLAEAEWADINGELSDPLEEDETDDAASEEGDEEGEDEDEDEDEDEEGAEVTVQDE
jgi:hypothetical protein